MRRSLPSFEMLNPRNLRSSGRATALFASLTFSRSFLVRNRLTEAITRSPWRQWQNGPNRFKELRRRRPAAIPPRMARLLRLLPDPACAWRIKVPCSGRRRFADGVLAHVRTPGGSTSTAQPLFRLTGSPPTPCLCPSPTRSSRRGTRPVCPVVGRGGTARCPRIPLDDPKPKFRDDWVGSLARYSSRSTMIFQKPKNAPFDCKRDIEMTPLCKIEATLPRVLGSREVRLGGVVDEQAGVQPA
jgi:hypothetical protein